jgi:DNA-binding transcriptional ArsR family regulator
MADQRSQSVPDSRSARQAREARDPRTAVNFVNLLERTSCKTTESYSTDRLTKILRRAKFNHMVEKRLDTTFAALADPTRRGILAQLTAGECSIGALAEPYRMSFAGAAKHVAVLERAGLIERRKVGRQQLCRLKAAPLAEAEAWLRQWQRFWGESLDRLEALIAEEKERAE